MKVASIIPALNEGTRIKAVLESVCQAELIDDIVVVSDGSTDNTYERAMEVPGVKAIELAHNIGKAGAMCVGANRVDAIVKPVIDGASEMCVGIFRGGRFLTDLSQKIAPVISGQRAIRRDLFMRIEDLEGVRMGVEIALTRWAHFNGIPVSTVVLDGVTHTMKEEKLGALRGFISRLQMYWDIGRVMLDGHKLQKSCMSGSEEREADLKNLS